MSAIRSKYAWIVICLASIFIYLKTDAIPLSSKPSLQLSSQLIDSFYDFDDAFEVASVPKTILKRSPDSDDNNTDDNNIDSDDSNKDSSTTEKPSGSDGGNFHHVDHHGHHGTTRRTVLKQPHPPHGDDHDNDDRNNNNSGSGGFNILEFFGTIFRLVWGFLSNIPALLFGSSSSSSSGGQ